MRLVLALAYLITGGLLTTKAITGATWQQVITGHAEETYTQNQATAAAADPAGGGGTVKVGKTTATETGFARSFLTAIGAPLNKTNISALEDWWAAEEGNDVLVAGHGGLNNPFEVTTSGNVTVPSLGSVNSAGVKSYATARQGVEAAIGYFQEYGPGVLEAFRKGQSITNIEAAVRDLGPNAFGSDTDSSWAVR